MITYEEFLREKIGNDEIYCFKDSYFIFISSENSNKGHAIIELCKILDIDLKDVDKYTEIKITKSINIITPGLNLILGNPYKIIVERVIPNDKT